MTPRVILTTSLALALAGCASGTGADAARQPTMPERLQSARQQVEQGTLAAKDVCVPPGMPAYTEWRGAVANRGGHVHALDKRMYKAANVTHTVDGKSVEGQWILLGTAWRLVAVDPAPDDAGVPVWIDTGFLAQPAPGSVESMVLGIADFKAPCTWVQQIVHERRPGDVDT